MSLQNYRNTVRTTIGSPTRALPHALIPAGLPARAATLSPRELRRIVADMLG